MEILLYMVLTLVGFLLAALFREIPIMNTLGVGAGAVVILSILIRPIMLRFIRIWIAINEWSIIFLLLGWLIGQLLWNGSN